MRVHKRLANTITAQPRPRMGLFRTSLGGQLQMLNRLATEKLRQNGGVQLIQSRHSNTCRSGHLDKRRCILKVKEPPKCLASRRRRGFQALFASPAAFLPLPVPSRSHPFRCWERCCSRRSSQSSDWRGAYDCSFQRERWRIGTRSSKTGGRRCQNEDRSHT
jgi:hypothetical protein